MPEVPDKMLFGMDEDKKAITPEGSVNPAPRRESVREKLRLTIKPEFPRIYKI